MGNTECSARGSVPVKSKDGFQGISECLDKLPALSGSIYSWCELCGLKAHWN